MKKFIIALSVLVLLFMALDAAHYRLGWYIDLMPEEPVTTFVKTDGKEIYLDCGEGWQPFEIRGVNMGSGIPGKWATEFAIDEETYRRWFGYIQAMGANTVRVYTIQGEAFYNAFYEYNKDNPEPLYLIHGVWVNDYVQNSHRDAYDKDLSCITSSILSGSATGRLSVSRQPRQVVRSPCGSASTRSTFLPCIAKPTPKFTVVVVLPTPPF